MGSRSNHSGGNWPMPGALRVAVESVKRIAAEGKANNPKEKSKRREAMVERNRAKYTGKTYAQSVGKPMKKIKSAEDAVDKLRKNRGGRLP